MFNKMEENMNNEEKMEAIKETPMELTELKNIHLK